jgi:hypothetical protein
MRASMDIDRGCALIAEILKKDGRRLETLRRLAAVDMVRDEVASVIEARLAPASK